MIKASSGCMMCCCVLPGTSSFKAKHVAPVQTPERDAWGACSGWLCTPREPAKMCLSDHVVGEEGGTAAREYFQYCTEGRRVYGSLPLDRGVGDDDDTGFL